MSTTASIKVEAQRIVDHLPDDATWEDLQYEIYVRQSILAGISDLDAGKTLTTNEVRERLGLRS